MQTDFSVRSPLLSFKIICQEYFKRDTTIRVVFVDLNGVDGTLIER